jgi:hypothetical protein
LIYLIIDSHACSFLEQVNLSMWFYFKLTEGILKSIYLSSSLDLFCAFPSFSSFRSLTFPPEWSKMRGSTVSFL